MIQDQYRAYACQYGRKKVENWSVAADVLGVTDSYTGRKQNIRLLSLTKV